MKIRLSPAAAVLFAGLSATASAGTITLSDRATVVSELGAAGVVEGFGVGTHFGISSGVLNSNTNIPAIGIVPGMILPNITYSTPKGSGLFFNIDSGGGLAGGFLDSVTGAQALTVTFAGPQVAFGFDTNNTMGTTLKIKISFVDGTSYNTTLAIPDTSSPTGFGFASNGTDIISATIQNPGSTTGFAVDNFTFNDSPPVLPEPASLALLGAGLAGLGLVRRRRRA